MNVNLQGEPGGQDRSTISEQMIAVRNRGLLNARDLSQEVERLGDWREHVRAYPVPLVLAAASLGYWVVPSRAKTSSSSPAPASENTPRSSAGSSTKPPEPKSSRVAGLSSAAFGFIGTLAANAVRNYISEQLHTLIQGDQHHEQQRKAPTRFSHR